MEHIRRNKNKIFIKIILSYIGVLLIPLVTGSVIYYESLRSATENAQQKNLMMLEQVRDMLDIRLGEVETIAQQIALNDKVISVLNITDIKEGSPEYYKVWDLCRSLPKYKLTNSLIYDYYVFFQNSKITATSNGAFFDSDRLYGKLFKYNDYSFEEWSQKLWETYHQREYSVPDKTLINGHSQKVTCYMQSIPNGSGSWLKGVAIIFINTKKLQDMLQRFDLGNTGFVCITDKSSKIITYIAGRDAEINKLENDAAAVQKYMKNISSDSDYILSNTVSTFNEWNFISVIPSSVVMAEVNYIKNITIILMLVTLFLGILISYILTYRKAKSLKNVIDKFKEVFGVESVKDKNEYHFIEGAVSSLIQSNIGLQKKMSEQIPLLEAALLRRLLHGEVQGGAEDYSLFTYTQMDTGDRYVSIIIICMQDYVGLVNEQVLYEYDETRVLVKNTLNLYLKHKHYLLDIDEKTIAMMLVFDSEDIDECKRQIKGLVEELSSLFLQDYRIELSFAVADVHKRISNVHKAFMEAKYVLDYMKFNKADKAIWYESLPIESDNYYYPIDLELRLISLVKSGDIIGVQDTIKDIYHENFNKRNLSPKMVQSLVLAMKSTVIRELGRLSFDSDIKAEIDALDAAGSVDEKCNYIMKANLEICRLINEQKRKDQSVLLDSILKNLDIVYEQGDLTIGRVAVSFGVSETVVYHLFKEILGVSFADYLENLRINHACEFLSKGEISIKDIAVKVGYNSDNSFRRAFKRIMRVSPSNYSSAVQ